MTNKKIYRCRCEKNCAYPSYRLIYERSIKEEDPWPPLCDNCKNPMFLDVLLLSAKKSKFKDA